MLELFERTTDAFLQLAKSPTVWWVIVISLLYIIDKFDLGVHSLSWLKILRIHRYNADEEGKEDKIIKANGVYAGLKNSELEHNVMRMKNGFGHSTVNEHVTQSGNSTQNGLLIQKKDLIQNGDIIKNRKANGHTVGNGHAILNGHKIQREYIVENGHVLIVLKNFILNTVIPTFRWQAKGEPDFSVLVFSNISSMQRIKEINFSLVTFDSMPLVNSKMTTYPQSYRYDNYIVARPSGSNHAEDLIINELKSLIKAYGTKERCFLRNPVPKFGLLYSWTMPCSDCAKAIASSLSKLCSYKFVLVYSQQNYQRRDRTEESLRVLKEAGVLVAKVVPECH